MRIGMAKADITPPTDRMNLAGQGFYRISTHIESQLYANAFAAEADGEQFVLCSCDVVGISREMYTQVQALVRDRCAEINVDRIILCATHTHTAPYTSDMPHTHTENAAFLPEGVHYKNTTKVDADVWMGDRTGPYLAQKTAEAICNAWEARRKGYFAPAFGRVAVGMCRRTEYKDGSAVNYGITNTTNFARLQGGSDSGTELLYVFNENKKPIGALVNIACPSQVVEVQHFVSSDFWGKTRDILEAELGSDFVTVGLCSAAGDQAPRDIVRYPRPNFIGKIYPRRADVGEVYSTEAATDIGESIAIEVLRRLKKITAFYDSALIRHSEACTMSLPLLRITAAQYAEAQADIESYLQSCGRVELNDQDMERLKNSLSIVKRYRAQETEIVKSVPVHVVRFADMAFITNPCELFLDYGIQMKARSHATQTFVIQLACDKGAYLPTETAQRTGGYGAVPAVVKFGADAGAILVETTLQRMYALFEK